MPQVQGEISAIRKDRKGIQVDGQWYSSFQPLPQGIEKGVVVEFEFQQKGQWSNLKGVPTILGGNSPVVNEPTRAAPSSTVPHYEKNAGFLVKQFPIPFDHPDRSIIRQNSLSHAVELVTSGYAVSDIDGTDNNEVLARIFSLAAEFEKYSTGDNEREAAEAEVTEE